jgi:hypothetical protein
MNDESAVEEAKQRLLLNKATSDEAQPNDNDEVSFVVHFKN